MGLALHQSVKPIGRRLDEVHALFGASDTQFVHRLAALWGMHRQRIRNFPNRDSDFSDVLQKPPTACPLRRR
jgi:hypothetical protein